GAVEHGDPVFGGNSQIHPNVTLHSTNSPLCGVEEILRTRAVQRKVVSPERFVFRGCGARATPPIALIRTPAREEPAEPNEGQHNAPPVAVYASLPAARGTLHQTKSRSQWFQNSQISTGPRFYYGCGYL